MKLLNIILCIAFLAAILAPFLIVAVKQSGRTLVANSREIAQPGNRYLQLAGNSAALNDASHFFGAFAPSAGSGIILAANDANFDASHLSEPLTEFISDTPDEEGLDVLLEAMAPSVPVGRAFDYLVHNTLESFQLALNDEDIREIGGEFPKIKTTGTQTNGKTQNKGLTVILDNDQGGEDNAVQQRWVTNLRNRLLRTEIYRTEALLEANDTALTPNWGGTNTAADPDGNIAADLELGGDARGMDSNTVVYCGGAWLRRFLSLGLGSNAARHQTRNLTPAQLAELIGADKVIRAKIRYQSSATAKTKIGDNKVFSYYTKLGATPNDPSNIKRFVTPVPGGGVFRIYIQPILKRTAVTVEHYSSIDLTSSLGIRKTAPTYT
jgi:hypothetical protein